MDRETTTRVARAGARLVARLVGLGDVVGLIDDMTPSRKRRSASPTDGDGQTVLSIVMGISRQLEGSTELGRMCVPANDAQAAADAVVRRLDSTPLAIDVVAALSVDDLYRLLSHDEAAAHRDLGTEASFEYYRALLYEACFAICRSILGDPLTVPLLLKELLRRHDDRVLVTWRERYAAEMERQAYQWRLASQSYCARVVLDLDRFEIPGIDIGRSAWSCTLLDAFTIPTLAASGRPRGTVVPESILRRGTSAILSSAAGNGKSSLLRHLAICAASTTLRTGATSDRLVPFIVKLRNLGTDPRLANSLVPQLSGHAIEIPEDFLRAQVEAGHAALLFDGFDEVHPRRRTEVGRWISSLQDEYCRRGTVVIVSTRSDVVGELEQLLDNFTWRGLTLMGRPEARRYARRWMAKLESMSDPASAVDRTTPRPHLAMLRDIPAHRLDAFLTVALRRPTSEPQREALNMERVIAMWCSRRDAERGIKHLPLSRRSMEEILEELALAVLLANPVVSRENALSIIESLQETTAQADLANPRAGIILDDVIGRTGLAEFSCGRLRFRTRALRDYLAARAVTRRPSPGRMELAATAAHANEFARWLGALASPDQLDSLLGALTRKSPSPFDPETGAKRLAVIVCCGAATDPPGKWWQEYQVCVEWSIRTRGTRDVALIARGGARAVSAVSVVLEKSVTEAELCAVVEILAQSRCGDALPLLVDIARSSRGTVREAIVECLKYWEDAQYALEVLGAMPTTAPRLTVPLEDESQLTLLDCIPASLSVRVTLNEPLSEAPVRPTMRSIDHLEVVGWTGRDLARFLESCPNVRRIRIGNPGHDLAETLTGRYPAVREIEIDVRPVNGDSVEALSAHLGLATDALCRHLTGLTLLRTLGPVALDIGEGTSVPSLDLSSPFSVDASSVAVDAVRRLRLVDSADPSFSWLATLRGLEMLEIVGADRVESLACGNPFPALRALVVIGCPELTELPDLASLDALESLHVSECPRLAASAWEGGEFLTTGDVALGGNQVRDWHSWFDSEGLFDGSDIHDPETLALFREYHGQDPDSATYLAPYLVTAPMAEPSNLQSRAGVLTGPSDTSRDRPTSPATKPPMVTLESALAAITSSVAEHVPDGANTRRTLAWLDWLAASIRLRPDIGMRKVPAEQLSALQGDPEAICARLRLVRVLPTSIDSAIRAFEAVWPDD